MHVLETSNTIPPATTWRAEPFQDAVLPVLVSHEPSCHMNLWAIWAVWREPLQLVFQVIRKGMRKGSQWVLLHGFIKLKKPEPIWGLMWNIAWKVTLVGCLKWTAMETSARMPLQKASSCELQDRKSRGHRSITRSCVYVYSCVHEWVPDLFS